MILNNPSVIRQTVDLRLGGKEPMLVSEQYRCFNHSYHLHVYIAHTIELITTRVQNQDFKVHLRDRKNFSKKSSSFYWPDMENSAIKMC